jgi:cyclase
MADFRIIARLDVKPPFLIKGVHFEGLRKLGDPQVFAEKYYSDGIDEIIYIDAVASLYQRNTIKELVKKTATNVFIPITAGGGVRSVDDVQTLLRVGADKVAVNTAAVHRPKLISEICLALASQCIVLSIQAKRHAQGWEAYSDQGREHTNLDAVEWARRGEELGAGEILVTSVDQEGTKRGFDTELIKAVTEVVSVPVIASGGMGKIEDLIQMYRLSGVRAVAIANLLHYDVMDVATIRAEAMEAGIPVRAI